MLKLLKIRKIGVRANECMLASMYGLAVDEDVIIVRIILKALAYGYSLSIGDVIFEVKVE